MHTPEYILRKLFYSFVMAEAHDSYRLLVRHIKLLSYVEFNLRASDEIADYLLKSCFRADRFFPGAFLISIDRLEELEGADDLEEIGSHDILDKVGRETTLPEMVDAGQFNFVDSASWVRSDTSATERIRPTSYLLTDDSVPLLKMTPEDILIKYLWTAWIAEERDSNPRFFPRDLRKLRHGDREVELPPEISEYLFKSCLRLNRFFRGFFNKGVFETHYRCFEDIAEIDDETPIGSHGLKYVGSMRTIVKMIDSGEFNFSDSGNW